MKEINNAEVDNAKDTDVVMAMYNLAEFSDIYSKKCRNVWQYYRDEPALYSNNNITDFPANTNNSISNRISFKYEKKKKITGKTGNDGTKDAEIMVPLKYLSNFWSTLEKTVNCEINHILTWFAIRFLVAGTVTNQVPTFAITDTKLYVPVVTLSTQDNAK